MSSIEAPDRPLRIIGLMSGTSMDGVDAAYIETDGADHLVTGPDCAESFALAFRARLTAFIGGVPERGQSPDEAGVEAALTDLHVRAVQRLLATLNLRPTEIDAIGFHGQTVWHRPAQRATWQMGDAQRLADATGITVVSDFRTADVAAGGQGAPLVPIFHAALAQGLARPLVVANIGGVSNITWIGGASNESPALLAFDTGPGNGLMDDWVKRHTGQPMDADGVLAARGQVRRDILQHMMAHDYFAQRPPKSLDRFDFTLAPVEGLSLEDGAATLTAFTAACIARGLDHCPAKPKRLLVTGGGRHNPTLMTLLGEASGLPVDSVDRHGWRGDAVEAQAFAYLAARRMRGLPITFPGTTGVAQPLIGGVITPPHSAPTIAKAANG